MSPTLATDRLRGAGVRVTSARVTVLEVLEEHPHSDAATVLRLARERRSELSVQGVYDVLNSLTSRGVLRRIQPAHTVTRYEVDHGDNHHHVVCRGCDRIVDVACADGGAPCLDASRAEALGFAVDEAEVLYWGRCPDCRSAAPAEEQSLPTTRTTSSHHTEMKEMA